MTFWDSKNFKGGFILPEYGFKSDINSNYYNLPHTPDDDNNVPSILKKITTGISSVFSKPGIDSSEAKRIAAEKEKLKKLDKLREGLNKLRLEAEAKERLEKLRLEAEAKEKERLKKLDKLRLEAETKEKEAKKKNILAKDLEKGRARLAKLDKSRGVKDTNTCFPCSPSDENPGDNCTGCDDYVKTEVCKNRGKIDPDLCDTTQKKYLQYKMKYLRFKNMI